MRRESVLECSHDDPLSQRSRTRRSVAGSEGAVQAPQLWACLAAGTACIQGVRPSMLAAGAAAAAEALADGAWAAPVSSPSSVWCRMGPA